MPNPPPETLTERQRAWMASIREGMERETGKTIEQWVEIAKACPETKRRARLAWMKDQHGLGQNRAAMILNAAFPEPGGWSEPDVLADTLWADPGQRAIFEAARAVILELPEVVVGQRKTYSAFSRAFQFAALRPQGKAGVLFGLAVAPDAAPGLVAPKRPVWSERLKAETVLTAPSEVEVLAPLIEAAWKAS